MKGKVLCFYFKWKIAADAMLKRAERVEQGIETIIVAKFSITQSTVLFMCLFVYVVF